MTNSNLGKDVGVLFGIFYLIHQHALALDVIQVLDGGNYFFNLAKDAILLVVPT